jgi:hypothetical protein
MYPLVLRFPQLRALHLRGSNFGSMMIEPLSKSVQDIHVFGNLEELRIENMSEIGQSSKDLFSAFPPLRRLYIANSILNPLKYLDCS